MSNLSCEDLMRLRRHVRRHPDTIGRAGYLFDEICDAHTLPKGCIMRDETFAGHLGVSTRTIRQWLTCLMDMGVVARQDTATGRKLVPVAPAGVLDNTRSQQDSQQDVQEDNFQNGRQLPKSASKLEDNFQDGPEDNFQHRELYNTPVGRESARTREATGDGQPGEPPTPTRRADPTDDATGDPVAIYRHHLTEWLEVNNRRASSSVPIRYQELIRAAVTDTQAWDAHLVRWQQSGYRMPNVPSILDAYEEAQMHAATMTDDAWLNSAERWAVK